MDGQLISIPSEISNTFDAFVVSIGENLASKIKTPVRTALDWLKFFKNSKTKLFFSFVTPSQVRKLLEGLKPGKAAGLDDIQAKLLKISAPAISESLCFLQFFL